jgi:hypothetical protein
MYDVAVATRRRSTSPPQRRCSTGPDETVRLERAEVVVHLLAREPDARRERRRRAGLRQLGQEARANRIERHHRRGGIIDDFEVGDDFHGGHWTIDNFCCQ